VLGQDWVPVRPDGLSTLEQMVHVPHTYLRPGKTKNIRPGPDGFVSATQAQTQLPGKVLLVGGGPNYYHWLIDHLPRLLLARRYGMVDGWPVLVNDDLAPFQRETLDLLGIAPSHRVPVAAHEAVRASAVCVPTMLTWNTAVHPLVRTLLQEALPPSTAASGRRIYLSRQDGPNRRLVNEDALCALLDRFGFERLLPSGMSLQQQIDACAGADIVVAVHGAALANTLFCRPGTDVVEIFTPAHQPTFFIMMSHVAGLPHHMVPAALVDPRPDMAPLHHDWEVDVAAMEQVLRAQLVD
jgi:capsular polysaccharide biosynthesis protein